MNQPTDSEIPQALGRVRARITAAEQQFGRAANSVSLLAVSKTKSVSAIRSAMAAGQVSFGENYVDEAIGKVGALKSEHCEWHFIGAIQSNKTRQLAEHMDWVHTIEREKIVQRLAQQRPAGLAPLNVCIQLNLDQEESKAGIAPTELDRLCEMISEHKTLKLRGLMIIPAPRETFDKQRRIFAEVRELYERQRRDWPQLDTLSMGMTSDLEAAIAEGSTMVRVGSAIFGARSVKI